ncbi:MAG: 50S ribosome-binding GTPase [Dermabacter sp.]|nr:50S ribosome-binding GTPase [Dermabacter sp.]
MTSPSTIGVLAQITQHLDAIEFPFDIRGADPARRLATQVRGQVADHIEPRLSSLDAPLLAVVGGSTGAGKSTLVNTLVGREISRAGAIRPTTRQPVLVHHPDDAAWFTGPRVLPSLPRVSLSTGGDSGLPTAGEAAGQGVGTALHVVASERVPRGIAILDAPDIDSVSEENRALAGQLLRAADLWVFVTTAHRYADAVPWNVLAGAAERDVTLAIIMNRIPERHGVAEELGEHLGQMLAERGVQVERLFLVHEQPLGPSALLEGPEVEELRAWITGLAEDSAARSDVARRTLAGALASTATSLDSLAARVSDQEDEQARLASLARAEFDAAEEDIAALTRDGALLRGEVLARWQDVVGTGEFFKGLQGWISRTRDRLGAALTGKTRPVVAAETAIETGLVSVVIDQCANARARTVRAWTAHEAGSVLLQSVPGLERDLTTVPPGFRRQVEDQVRAWQKDVLELVTTEGSGKRVQARVLSLGVNVVGIALMIVVFASTAFIPTGLEVGAGAATALVGQKLLESIFGDEAVRRLATTARANLDERMSTLVDGESAAFARVLADHPITISSRTLREDAAGVRALIEAQRAEATAEQDAADGQGEGEPA